jgi:L-threonylcarbamoyladenylate synthase
MVYAMENSDFLSSCSADTIKLAAHSLINGNLVAFPTETVYGLGADALNSSAVSRIYDVKGRPHDHPLIVHVHDLNAIDEWVSEIPEYAIQLARDYWPGPMTLILNRSKIVGDFITGGQDTVGIRIPDHPIALALLNSFHEMGGMGVAAPSANRFGHVSPTSAEAVSLEIADFLGNSDMILDGGECQVGVESTIIDCTRKLPSILRPGAISGEMIEESVNLKVKDKSTRNNIRVSGVLEKHYSPMSKVFLDQTPVVGQGYLALSNLETPTGVTRLASPNNVEEFARVLYQSLRRADELNLQSLVVQQPEGEGLAIAIRDRLAKAVNGR